MKPRRVESAPLDPQLELLRSWQSERLARTYADFLTSPRYGPACRFFLRDIYAPRDLTQRNTDMERLHEFLARFLPPGALETLTDTIELHTLTEELDRALLTVLVEDLGVTDSITVALYAEAYRICDNYDERKNQIDLIIEVGQSVDRLVRLPFIGTTFRLFRGPAHSAGWGELHDFLERGYNAFKRMKGAERFLRTIQERETRILDQIFGGDPDPFAI
ncbi:MAG: hypothetical protein M5U01_42055 [Ardenticatenaceae bacterium]|nr:hypothetical protein [Ardenticatenaceae bacterium]